jgi:hypothetical protein
MTLKTPEKRHHDALSGTAPSPLVSKRHRTSTHQLSGSQDMETRYLPQVTGLQLPELDLDTLIPLSLLIPEVVKTCHLPTICALKNA